MLKPLINYVDIGALDGNEALSFFSSTEQLGSSLGRDILDLTRMITRRAHVRPPFGLLRGRRLLQRRGPIDNALRNGTVAVNMILVDPQLSDKATRRLRRIQKRQPNLVLHEVKCAVGLTDERFAMAPLYMGLTGTKLQRLRAQARPRDERIGATLFPAKMNVHKTTSRHVLTLSVAALIELLDRGEFFDEKSFNILRMNAEGIEFDILLELERRRLLHRIDLLCGSGHDLRKIDITRFQEFQHYLDERGLRFEPFDGDDWRRASFQKQFACLIVEGAFSKSRKAG